MSRRSEGLPRPSLEWLIEHYGSQVTGSDAQEWRKCRCVIPGHDDYTPSMSVNTDIGRWKCRTCDKHGDELELIKEVEGLAGFADIKRRAQELVGESGTDVQRATGPRSSGLSRRQGSRPGRRRWSPTWTSM